MSPLSRPPGRPPVPVLVALALAAPLCLGCRSASRVRPEPLHPADVLERLDAERARPLPSGGLTLARAAEAMRAGNPRVREARARLFAAEHVASVKTPRPNPVIEVAPLLISSADVLSSAIYGIETALGWAVLLVDTPELADDVNAERAKEAFTDAAATEREEYLALRGELLAAGLADARLRAHEALATQADEIASVAEDLVASGAADAVDAGLLALDADRVTAALLATREADAERRAALGARLGAAADGVAPPAPDALPSLPERLPARQRLAALAVRHHPALDRIRGAYRVAETELRLELGRRVPRLEMGAGREDEGEDLVRWGFPLAVEIPVSDRNQPAVAAVHAERVRLRAAFRARLAEILAAIDTARSRVERRRARLAQIEDVVLPRTDEAVEATRVGVREGTTDALRYVDVLRTEREVVLERFEARAAVFAAWSDLERAVGAPLLAFPAEPGPPRDVDAAAGAPPAPGFPPPHGGSR